MTRIVVALGGNALIHEHRETILDQLASVDDFAPQIVDLVAAGHEVVLTHGNGPQVGYILRRSELSRSEVAPVPIDFAVGDTQGAIGHMFLLALRNELRRRALTIPVAALVTQVIVDPLDVAFSVPAKPIGAFFDEVRARELAAAMGWTVAEDSGRGWRRTVASPSPVAIPERGAIETLLRAGTIVVACGGGGIPVSSLADGTLERVEAVVDKDLTSALLAHEIDADVLVILTTTEQVAVAYGRPEQRWLSSVTAAEATQWLAAGEFGAGSMQPKVEAAVGFVTRSPKSASGGRSAIITSPERLVAAVHGTAGTRILRDESPMPRGR
jgi:carbamate kinase